VGLTETQTERVSLTRLRHGVVELVSHTLMAGLILLAIKALELWSDRLWGTGSKLLFDKFPVRYLFDGADLVLLIGFLTFGIWTILKGYYRE